MIRRVALLSLHSSPVAPFGSPDVGGMNVYLRTLAEDLVRRGIQVDVFTRRSNSRAPSIACIGGGARLIQVDAGPPKKLPKSALPLYLPTMVDRLMAFIERECARYDVLHSHYWLSGVAAVALRDELDVPVIHMFHTLAKVKQYYLGACDPTDTLLRFDGERQVIDRADVIVGATAGERCLIERLYNTTLSDFAVIPPGTDLNQFRPTGRVESRSRLGIDADRVILFVGRPDRIKRLDLLLRSLAEIAPQLNRRLKLLVVGHRPTEDLEEYRHLAHKLGIAELVEWRGTVPQRQMPQFYSAADVCAIPSAFESWGMAAVESLACETPVVAFGVGGLAATVRDGQTGFLADPGQTSDFTAALENALTCAQLEAMGRQGRLSVQRFDRAIIAQKTADLYDRTALHFRGVANAASREA